jgi:hypothetical protein
MRKAILVLVWVCCIAGSGAFAQEKKDSLQKDEFNLSGIFPKQNSLQLGSVKVSGFYRFFATYQRQFDPYALTSAKGDTVLPRSVFIGDDAQLPNMLLNVSGNLKDGSSWGFDLRMFQFLNGNIAPSYGKQVADSLRPNLQKPLGTVSLGGNLGTMLGINLYGNFKTRHGNWGTRIGGIQYLALSDLTMSSFRGYNRFMLFERNPWDPMGRNISDRYRQYFDQGSIDQDMRWGNRAFQGLVVEGTELPGRWAVLGMLGKSELNGGFSSTPSFTYGGKIKKLLKNKDFVALNSFNSLTYTDSLARHSFGLNVITAEFIKSTKYLLMKGEIGAGQYFSPIHKEGFGELMQFKVSNVDRGGWAIVELHYFRISQKVVDNSALYWNTATREYSVNNLPAGSVGSSTVLQPFGSSMVRVGQMTNNRQGANINVQAGKKKFKINAGIGSSAELTPSAAAITVGHPVNQYTRSRFWRWNFPANVGPYSRYSDIYRDTYETVKLSDDSSGVVVNKKFFNSMEVQLKYQTQLFGHDCYLFGLFQANSSSRHWSPITVTNEKAYVRQYASEIEAYIKVNKTMMLNGYFGIERTLGNYLTEINEDTRRPLNQFGRGIGLGCDFDLGKNARLYVRHRWYSFEDKSFELDQFRGRELMVELKAFF